MNTHALSAAALLVVTSSAAYAVGLDRSGRPTGLIFESGNMFEFSAGYVSPSIDGTEVDIGLGQLPTGNIADTFRIWGAGLRYELSDTLALGVIIDEPYGANILYASTAPLLSGTAATVDSRAITGFVRYKFNENISAHGGIVYQSASADVTLSGQAYQSSGLNGYNAAFSKDYGVGYMIGAAYEIPEIALRAALTYHSEIDHSLDTTQTINGAVVALPSTTDVTTPETIELAFRTGVAADTLMFGSVRFSHYSVTSVRPTLLGGTSLTALENAWQAEIGLGRRFNDKWAGSLSVGWEQKGEDDLVSPLGATNGATFVSLGASYQATDTIKISGGIRYNNFGDANAEVGGTAVGSFSGNSAVSAGLKLQIGF
jgi:long-subunit fatty acid transport protein